ncbi:hypothetical protein BOTBODRAFT_25833 [Botryobasidium botryosum FD-172 SS1]|uniref:Palmitoyl-protein thioesterase 1 n=1 Tax=Botryobasidium botryosum (strain FD-172 SS1) TaxID=930990 RepID=A0A067N0M9_BOTB1|nr:hypothetical protein BOTBODRAFT_25833 [Botryobasidium botryosum FD-172 SS1]
MLATALGALLLPLAALALPFGAGESATNTITRNHEPESLPLVIWHGMGDSHSSPGMLKFGELIQKIHPRIFIHSVYIEEKASEDQKAGFFGDLEEQLEVVSEQLRGIPELQDGFDAIGFSQGGQFMRAYVEWYNDPPVHNLITFGSQHMGVAGMPPCRAFDVICLMARAAANRGVYTEWAQKNLIQAQYYRDPARLEQFLEYNRFLTRLNGEVPETRNATYARNLASLSNLVLVMFSEDDMVIPKESSWFGSYTPVEDPEMISDSQGASVNIMGAGGIPREIVPMRMQPMYVEDWVGLRELDERGGVSMEICEQRHMHLPPECWEGLVKRFVGGGWGSDDRKAGSALREEAKKFAVQAK